MDGGSTDNCSIDSITVSQTTFGCGDVGANTVTLSLLDPSGNSSSCTATVTVEDNIAPTAVCQDITVHLDASGSATITAGDLDQASTDACGIQGFSASQTIFSCSDVGTVSDTLTVTDVNTNTSSCLSVVTVVDTVAPSPVCQNVTVYLDGSGNGSVNAADADGGSSDACGIGSLTTGTTVFTCGNVGTTFSDTLFITDVNSNVASCTFSIDVADTIAPTAVCQNVTVQLDGMGNAFLSPMMVEGGSSDNCQLAMPMVSDTLFTCVDIGANTVTLTHTDVNGNTGNCTATVTVQDILPPVAQCSDITTYLDTLGVSVINTSLLDNSSFDNCGIASITASIDTFTCADLGVQTVTVTFADPSGNVSNCFSDITVVDTVAPTAICVDDTIYLDNTGKATADANVIGVNTTDNCSLDTLKLDITEFECADIGANTVVLSVLDGSNNGSTCTAVVTVLDTIPPSITCTDYTLFLDSLGNGTLAPPDVTTGPPTDNCGGVGAPVLSQTSFTRADTGVNAVTVTVTDSSGNVSSCVSNVSVVDSFFVGIEEELAANGFSFTAFPNPTNGDLFVEVVCEACTPGEPTQLMITSMLGEVLYREEVEMFGGRLKRTFDFSPWSQGTYVLSIRQRGKTVNRRIVRH